MRRLQKRKGVAAWPVIVLFLTIYIPSMASQEKIDETKQTIDRLEDERRETGGRLEALEQDAAYLDGRIKELNGQLATLAGELNRLEQEIQEKEESILVNEALLVKARDREKEQYEDMKLRIRFLYERGDSELLEQFLTAESISDFLNFGEYVESVHSYDRQMLEEYRTTKAKIMAAEDTLLAERQALMEDQELMEEKKIEVQSVLAQVQENLSDTQGQISAAQNEMAKYDQQIQQQKAYEAELERQKAEAEAKRLAEEKAQQEAQQKPQKPAEDLPPLAIEGTADDTAMLAALIECEAGGESYEGKLAVGSVVLNRVRSPRFPNTLAGVIYQSGQFSPVASGRFATVLSRGASDSCVQAAQETLGGNLTLDCLYFRVNNGTIEGIVIGNHVFY